MFALLLLLSACSLGAHGVQAQTYSCAAPNSSSALALQDYTVNSQ